MPALGNRGKGIAQNRSKIEVGPAADDREGGDMWPNSPTDAATASPIVSGLLRGPERGWVKRRRVVEEEGETPIEEGAPD